MAVRIRLNRVGKKKVPFYRVVVMDSRKARDGQALDILGTYNGLTGEVVNFNMEKYTYWIGCGAQPLASVEKVKKIYSKSSAASSTK
jgi:small subunit ribosomal protein S16